MADTFGGLSSTIFFVDGMIEYSRMQDHPVQSSAVVVIVSG
jgi:hypothetical protein